MIPSLRRLRVIQYVIISVVHSAYSAEGDTQRGLLRTEAALKNLTIYSKTALAVYKRRRFQLELMTGFEPVTSSLPRMRSTD